MEAITPLVRATIRAFYTDEHAVVIEPLLREPYYLEDDQLAKGVLSRKMGFIASKRIRKLLETLVEHSLLEKKEIVVKMNLETFEADRSRHKNFFYFINVVHFLKILTLRLELVKDFINSSKRTVQEVRYRCPQPLCPKLYSIHEAMQHTVNGRFLCVECDHELVEAPRVEDDTVLVFDDAVLPKFKLHLQGELDFRDSIEDMLQTAHHKGRDLPDNDPSRKLKALELTSLAKRQKLKAKLLSGEGEDENEEEEEEEFLPVTNVVKEMPPWFKITLNGQETEDALKDTEFRRLGPKQLKQEETELQGEELAYVRAYEERIRQQQQQQEQQPPQQPQSSYTQEDTAEFVFQDGRRIRRNISSQEQNELFESCPDEEYEALVQFLSGTQ